MLEIIKVICESDPEGIRDRPHLIPTTCIPYSIPTYNAASLRIDIDLNAAEQELKNIITMSDDTWSREEKEMEKGRKKGTRGKEEREGKKEIKRQKKREKGEGDRNEREGIRERGSQKKLRRRKKKKKESGTISYRRVRRRSRGRRKET